MFSNDTFCESVCRQYEQNYITNKDFSLYVSYCRGCEERTRVAVTIITSGNYHGTVLFNIDLLRQLSIDRPEQRTSQ